MYSLIVSSGAINNNPDTLIVDNSRFLEYTESEISAALRTLSLEAVAALCSWPCILIEEGKGGEIAQIVLLSDIALRRAAVSTAVTKLNNAIYLTNEDLWKLRAKLDIGDFEFSRNHWAVKGKDLFQILTSSGLEVTEHLRSRFICLPLPAPNRQKLLEARNVISEWGHSELDDILLEIGIEELSAGRGLGSRRDRANAILTYAISHPGALTAERNLLSAYLVARAFDAQPSHLSHLSDSVDSVSVNTTPDISKTRSSSASVDEAIVVKSERSPNRVFIVHGRNEQARMEVSAYLSSIGLEAIILHEQPNMGRHLLTKFIEEAELVTFAVILMTDDDFGSVKGGIQSPRARQNVILELGYFLSHLGQANVCALITPGLETPSDFDGIIYISMKGDGAWKKELRRELVAARMPVQGAV